jgi:hypothetical protein
MDVQLILGGRQLFVVAAAFWWRKKSFAKALIKSPFDANNVEDCWPWWKFDSRHAKKLAIAKATAVVFFIHYFDSTNDILQKDPLFFSNRRCCQVQHAVDESTLIGIICQLPIIDWAPFSVENGQKQR